MPTHCRQSRIVAAVAVAGWAAAFYVMLGHHPAAGTTGERLFYMALLVGIGASILVTLPWMLRGYIHGQVLAYCAGYLHRSQDDLERERERVTNEG